MCSQVLKYKTETEPVYCHQFMSQVLPQNRDIKKNIDEIKPNCGHFILDSAEYFSHLFSYTLIKLKSQVLKYINSFNTPKVGIFQKDFQSLLVFGSKEAIKTTCLKHIFNL